MSVHLPILATANQDMEHPPLIYRSFPGEIYGIPIGIPISYIRQSTPGVFLPIFQTHPHRRSMKTRGFLSQDHPTDHAARSWLLSPLSGDPL